MKKALALILVLWTTPALARTNAPNIFEPKVTSSEAITHKVFNCYYSLKQKSNLSDVEAIKYCSCNMDLMRTGKSLTNTPKCRAWSHQKKETLSPFTPKGDFSSLEIALNINRHVVKNPNNTRQALAFYGCLSDSLRAHPLFKKKGRKLTQKDIDKMVSPGVEQICTMVARLVR